MKVLDTRLPGVKRIEPAVHADDRGHFLESYQARRYAEMLGTSADFVQDNCSHSRKGVLRGLHYQVRHPQGKLIRVSHGAVFDVAVDLRPGSPTFGQWEGLVLSAEGQHAPGAEGTAPSSQLWIPPGFAHGFLVLSDSATVDYKCTDYYHPEDETCLRWDDPDLAIAWPQAAPILSERDRQGQTLKALRQAGRLPMAGNT
ncbi:MAG: dTDP-4-dehydrorhamnose 3,5-epimerase [Burkholderiaceae bacterium]